jgi:hypothetical protein
MVIDIALGIVLAVLILRYWPAIVAAGVLSIFAFAAITIVGSIIYAISLHEALVKQIAIVSIALCGFLVITFIAHLISKRTVLTSSEISVLLVITFMLVSASSVFFKLLTTWAEQANDITVYLYSLPIFGLWVWVWKRLLFMVRSRKDLAKNET